MEKIVPTFNEFINEEDKYKYQPGLGEIIGKRSDGRGYSEVPGRLFVDLKSEKTRDELEKIIPKSIVDEFNKRILTLSIKDVKKVPKSYLKNKEILVIK